MHWFFTLLPVVVAFAAVASRLVVRPDNRALLGSARASGLSILGGGRQPRVQLDVDGVRITATPSVEPGFPPVKAWRLDAVAPGILARTTLSILPSALLENGPAVGLLGTPWKGIGSDLDVVRAVLSQPDVRHALRACTVLTPTIVRAELLGPLLRVTIPRHALGGTRVPEAMHAWARVAVELVRSAEVPALEAQPMETPPALGAASGMPVVVSGRRPS